MLALLLIWESHLVYHISLRLYWSWAISKWILCDLSPFTSFHVALSDIEATRTDFYRHNKVFVLPPASIFAPYLPGPKHWNVGMCPSQGAYQHSVSHRIGSSAFTTGYCLTCLCRYAGRVNFFFIKAYLSLVFLFVVLSWFKECPDPT